VKAVRKLKSMYKKRNKADSREGFAGGYMHTSCVHHTIRTSLCMSEVVGICVKQMHHLRTLMEHIVILAHKCISNLHTQHCLTLAGLPMSRI
jgi:hypothetical protein